MPEITMLVDSCGDQNNINVMIHFPNMIKEGILSGTDNFHFFIKGHTNNDCERVFNSLKVMYWKQNVFNFDKCREVLNTRNNVEVIQMFDETSLT